METITAVYQCNLLSGKTRVGTCKVSSGVLYSAYSVSLIRAGVDTEDSLIGYGGCFNWSRSTFTIHLQRKYLYYVIHLIIPYCFFCLIAVFTFILQPSRPERLNLGTDRNYKMLYFSLSVCNSLPVEIDIDFSSIVTFI